MSAFGRLATGAGRPFGDDPAACKQGLLQAHHKAARSLRALLLADGYAIFRSYTLTEVYGQAKEHIEVEGLSRRQRETRARDAAVDERCRLRVRGSDKRLAVG